MGLVFDIQRCSYHDGPGIRTTVFLKGCQLRCAWCHNPESFRPEPQLQYIRHLCVGCGKCAQVCPNGVHAFSGGTRKVDFSRCVACGQCAGACPADALKILGRQMSARQVMDVVLRDRTFYETSGGGMTVSGGEPTFQADFLVELLTLARENRISTCVETNGYIPAGVLSRLLPLVDLFLLDYKVTGDSALHSYTHASGTLWQNTLQTLQSHKIPVILRLPIIPGINDNAVHFRDIARIRRTHDCIQKVEIMPYHAIGAAKWEQLGYDYTLKALPGATPEQKALWQKMLDDAIAEAGDSGSSD